MNNLFDLTGRTCLLTGASKGIGKSMVIALAQHGGTIIISSRKIDVLVCNAWVNPHYGPMSDISD